MHAGRRYRFIAATEACSPVNDAALDALGAGVREIVEQQVTDALHDVLALLLDSAIGKNHAVSPIPPEVTCRLLRQA